jgi:hypothetical protein
VIRNSSIKLRSCQGLLPPCLWEHLLGTFVQGVTRAVLIPLIAICAGCGGGPAAFIQQQQPQAADLSVAISSSSVTISQGVVSGPVNFSIIPHNGFNGNVQVTFCRSACGRQFQSGQSVHDGSRD